jgi:hypothetical protein
MHPLQGGCHCGNLRFAAQLTRPSGSYRPRACDCDFCDKHAAAYVSDPHGSLTITVRDATGLGRYRQGNGLAEMLLCRQCGVLLGALYASDGGWYGAVNARASDAGSGFGQIEIVSPRKLGEADKTRRWRELWFPNVAVRS